MRSCSILGSILLLYAILQGCSFDMPTPKEKQGTENAKTKSPPALLNELEVKFAELQAMQAKFTSNRQREEDELRAFRNELGLLRNRVEGLKPKTSSVSSESEAPVLSTRLPKEEEPLPSAEVPTILSKISKPEPKPESRPERVTSRPTPPPFLEPELHTYPEISQKDESSPPSITPRKESPDVAPPSARQRAMPPLPPLDEPSSPPSAPDESLPKEKEETGSLRVEALEKAQSGRILHLRGKGNMRMATLDIGSEAGLSKGSLVSQGEEGAETTVWQITSVQKYTSTAVPLPNQGRLNASAGEKMIQVRRK